MNSIRRIVKNSGASLLAQILTPATSFLLVFFIARILGVKGLGIFSSALSMLLLFQAFSSLGFQQLITREVAREKSKASKFLINASFLGGIFSVFMAGVMCLSVNLITQDIDIIHAVYVLSLSLTPFTLALICQSICRAFERIEYITISQIAGNLFKVLLGLLILMRGYGLIILMIVILGSHILIFFISLYFALKCTPSKYFRVDFSFCKRIIKMIPVFALIFVFSAIRRNVDILILTKMMGANEVGFYSAAYKLMNICWIGVSCYIIAVQPVIFRLFSSSFEKYKIVCKDSIRYLFILALPIVVGTVLLSDRFILLIFKAKFLPSSDVLRILVWLLILYSCNQIFSIALIASDRQKINLQGNIIGMISNVCLNILLISKYSFIGAGIANFSSTFIVFIYQYYFVSKYLFKVNFIKIIRKPIVATILMATVILLLKDINLILLIAVSATIYIFILLMLKTFSSNDKELIRKLFKGEEKYSLTKSKA